MSATGWSWYLDQAAQTIIAMTNGGVGYVNVGLMGETVFLMILQDLKRESLTSQFNTVQTAMQNLAKAWSGQRYPYARYSSICHAKV